MDRIGHEPLAGFWGGIILFPALGEASERGRVGVVAEYLQWLKGLGEGSPIDAMFGSLVLKCLKPPLPLVCVCVD